MKKAILKCFAILTAISVLLTATGFAAAADSVSVEPISFENPDFIRGMDVSSVLSLEEAGVVFRDAGGEEQDLFRILSDNGVNYIRVRVWNDPYDASGSGYGGGNNDLQRAVEIGSRAKRYGMKLLVDFHYSDFWADPSKQTAPKAWQSLTLTEKQNALYAYTLESLNAIAAGGADIGMVQIGNEINGGIAGENSWWEMSLLLKAGVSAVRAFSPDVLTVIHFTDPQRTDGIKALADFLHDYGVDYDVFAVSYYPYWHGSLENLTAVLGYVAENYGKYTMVAETSYAYTLDDSDGHGNTVSPYANCTGDDLLWDFTPQGQAQAVRSVMAAVNAVPGGKGLGVFYWEGAWITAGDTTGLSGDAYTARVNANRQLWEDCGCGWASSYAAAYDSDAGSYYGGSAVDNQAFFAPDGTALESLRVFRDVVPVQLILGDADGDGEVSSLDATWIQRFLACMDVPETFCETAADVDGDGEVTSLDVTWIQRYLALIDIPYAVNTPII